MYIFGVKGLSLVAKRCLNWISFHDDLCCCVEYSNVENQVEILMVIIQSDAQKQMVESSFGRRLMTLIILKLDLSFILLGFIFYLRASSKNFVENHQFNVILSYFKTNCRLSLVQFAHHLHRLLEYVNMSWICFGHYKSLGFVDQYLLRCSFTKS